MNVRIEIMTDEMYHSYAKEYDNDPDLFENKDDYYHYIYTVEKANSYLQRAKDKKRIIMAILNDDEVVGELIFKHLVENDSVTIGITMKNQKYKDKGYGTVAETLAIEYGFKKLNVNKIYADCLLSNTRSQHVLLKVGFKEIKRDDKFVFYEYSRK